MMATAESIEVTGPATMPGIVDHRPAVLELLKPLFEKLCDIYGANDFDADAWIIFGFALDKADRLIKMCAKSMPHAGSVENGLDGIVALMRGAELMLEHLDEEYRNVEEEGALAIVRKYLPKMRHLVDVLCSQSAMEQRRSRQHINTLPQ